MYSFSNKKTTIKKQSFAALIKQSLALISANFKSFPLRLLTSSISIISIACVSAVILAVLALTDGMVKTMARTGLDNTLLVMRAGAVSELQSVMFPIEVKILSNNPLIKHNANNDQAIYAAEMFVSAELKREKSQTNNARDKQEENTENLALRGISQKTYQFRPNFKIIAGKKFKTGVRQLLVGQAIARKMPELTVGKTITLGDSQWLISGVFSDNNSVFESELWADIGIVQSDYRRGNSVQSVRLALKDTEQSAISQQQMIEQLRKEWQADPRLNVRVISEKVFFAEQGASLTKLIRWIGLPIAIIMALGAVIAALNTMYAAITSRSKEIATHKAIGFTPIAIASSIISEALLLALLGGLLGVLPLFILFDDWTASSQNANSMSQIMFNFNVSPQLMAQAIALSLVIGLIGGILPAIKAMKLPVTVALRAS